mgnify:CR=1 FL=1
MTITITKIVWFSENNIESRRKSNELTLYRDRSYRFDSVEVVDVRVVVVFLENHLYVGLIYHSEIEIETYSSQDN